MSDLEALVWDSMYVFWLGLERTFVKTKKSPDYYFLSMIENVHLRKTQSNDGIAAKQLHVPQENEDSMDIAATGTNSEPDVESASRDSINND